MYYQIYENARMLPYLFGSMHDLPEKVDISGVYLWQKGTPILNKEVE
jgi:hypothetical protein